MNISKLIKSFGYASKGIYAALSQQNMRGHVLAVIVVVVVGWHFSISKTEWLIIVLICTLVISLEMINSALETLADAFHPDQNPLVGKAKDIAAGAVLLAAIAALIIAGIIFGNRIPEFFY
ncbi:MAG: diacylglycerol kinase family protein [Chitinophagales bacterium]